MPNTATIRAPQSSLVVDRGAAAAADFTESDLTLDAAPHSLDLSAIVPAGATWVDLQVGVNPNTIPGGIIFFMVSRGVDFTDFAAGSPIAGIEAIWNGTVRIDLDRSIGYVALLAAGSTINITVRGWTK